MSWVKTIKRIEIGSEPTYPMWGFHRSKDYFPNGTALLGKYKYGFGLGNFYILWGYVKDTNTDN